MSINKRVSALVARLAPHGVCEDCIGDTLKAEDHFQIGLAARGLIGQNGVERKVAICAICGESKHIYARRIGA